MIICVIFDLGMAVIMFLFGICFVKSNGKAAAFLSGYNMKSKEERKQYDEKEMCRVYGNRMMWMALPFVVGAAIDLLYSGIGCFAACVIWTFQFVLLMKERMKRRKNRKEHLGKNYMRKKIYKLSRNRIILGNKRNFNYLKEMT
ncbi:DUF3784 domain-containing protein [Ruminococcus sp. SR1/5]|uniref:DUF3784 domain-containing protein n=1 Tax=Ruminococcus sp. SR1/5 TaxID=657323 RepID=UPI0001CD686A|nr:DUF3784 domain-containing protein [Ruminococcus sp. SR1/5]CBL19115.1 hypothetical protein CK1_08770 [Ruminococcus sp. SR1/5]